MSLDYNLDRRVKLSEESEYGSLYKWFLQETDADGKPIGLPQVPFYHRLTFFASELKHNLSFKTEQNLPRNLEFSELRKAIHDESLWSSSVKQEERISGVLIPRKLPREDGHYSLFGTHRQIKTFSLEITKVKEGDKETASLWGSPGYTYEWDFQNDTQDDGIVVNLSVSSDRFEMIRDLIRSRRTDVVWVSLDHVFGFYSEWTPSIRTDSIKILTNKEDQKVEIPEGCTIDPTGLGFVGEFKIGFTQEYHLDTTKFPHDDSDEHSDEDTDESSSLDALEQGVPSHVQQVPSVQQPLDKLLRKILIPLWCIFGILVWELLRK